jgi:hypothetical protein
MLRAWSAVLRWTIGYGYRPALALVPLALLILIGSVLFQLVSHDPHLLHPAKTGAEQPSFNALRYTVREVRWHRGPRISVIMSRVPSHPPRPS